MRIAIVYEGSLLAQAAGSLLEGSLDAPIATVDLAEDGAAERLRALRPAVVVVDADDVAFRSCSLFQLLEGLPEVQLVCLHGGGDHVDLYRKTRMPVRGAHDVAVAVGAA